MTGSLTWQKNKRAILVIIKYLFLCLSCPVFVFGQSDIQATQWAWYRATSSGTKWFITQGKANIKIGINKKIDGRLYDADTNFIRHDISGNVSGIHITLLVVNNGTDAADEIFKGELHRLCYDSHSGQEYAELRHGPSFIGLLREIHGVSNCVSM